MPDDDFTRQAPARPIVIRPHEPLPLDVLPEPEPVRRGSHLTRRRIMYLVGLATQAAVLGAVVALGIAFEAPIRHALGLPQRGDAVAAQVGTLQGALATVDAKVTVLNARVDRLALTLGDSPMDAPPDPLAVRIDRIDAVVSRLEGKVDDVRDKALFTGAPAQPDR